MTKRVGQMRLSYELLAQMMKIDDHGYAITAVVPQTADDIAMGVFRVMVTGSHAPLVPEAGIAPEVQWFDPYHHFEPLP
jgi:hypothetical protein